MNCPRCKTDLVTSERKEIEVHCCPRCAGLWIESADLNEIIVRSALIADQKMISVPPTAGVGDHMIKTGQKRTA